jgi:hypothetical protein
MDYVDLIEKFWKENILDKPYYMKEQLISLYDTKMFKTFLSNIHSKDKNYIDKKVLYFVLENADKSYDWLNTHNNMGITGVQKHLKHICSQYISYIKGLYFEEHGMENDDLPVYYLDISKKVIRSFINAGYETVGKIRKLYWQDGVDGIKDKIRGVAESGICEICTALNLPVSDKIRAVGGLTKVQKVARFDRAVDYIFNNNYTLDGLVEILTNGIE